MQSPKPTEPKSDRARRAYTTPRLARFGGLKDLTAANAFGGGVPDGPDPKLKTGV